MVSELAAPDITFDMLRDLIEKLRTSGIPEWEVTDETAVAAIAHSRLLEAAGARCPRMFILEEEAIVFTWDLPGEKHYLTVSSEDVQSAMCFKQDRQP
jgi:hypothetical protein